ncbi:MAG: hypothetical protein U0797_06805 [Gemmataceae bacterium]
MSAPRPQPPGTPDPFARIDADRQFVLFAAGHASAYWKRWRQFRAAAEAAIGRWDDASAWRTLGAELRERRLQDVPGTPLVDRAGPDGDRPEDYADWAMGALAWAAAAGGGGRLSSLIASIKARPLVAGEMPESSLTLLDQYLRAWRLANEPEQVALLRGELERLGLDYHTSGLPEEYGTRIHLYVHDPAASTQTESYLRSFMPRAQTTQGEPSRGGRVAPSEDASSPVWRKYPFRKEQMVSGTFHPDVGRALLPSFIPSYQPSEAEVATLSEWGLDPRQPDWESLRGELLSAGVPDQAIPSLTASDVIRTLSRGAVPPSSGTPAGETQRAEGGRPNWASLRDAKRAILTVLSRASEPLQGRGVARGAGYKEGSLRHHYAELQTWGYIERTKDGYIITPTGAALVQCERV